MTNARQKIGIPATMVPGQVPQSLGEAAHAEEGAPVRHVVSAQVEFESKV
jgi:hypothetical protein